MYAIETYFIGPTNFRGSRIAARVCEKGSGYDQPVRRLTLPWDHVLSTSDNHRAALGALAVRLGWGGSWVEGRADHGASVWVNIDRPGK